MKNLFVFALLFSLTTAVFAQPGTLDATFGNGGIVSTQISTSYNFGNAMTIQADGKIVVVGQSRVSGKYNMSIVRYNPDGTLDDTFDSDGMLIIEAATVNNFANKVMIQSDNKIVIAGHSFNGSSADMVVVRLNPDGSIDNTFGTNGIATIDFAGANDLAESATLQADGKILLGGHSADNFSVVRLKTDGSLDSTFGLNGLAKIIFATGSSYIKDIIVQSDGKILTAGFASGTGAFTFALARFKTDGSLDSTFGTNGMVYYDFGSGDNFGLAVREKSDGKILIAGNTFISSPPLVYKQAVMQLNADGSKDNSFGTNGIARAGIANEECYANGLAIQPDGKIILAGYNTDGSTDDFILSRFNPDGSLDLTFGNNGLAVKYQIGGEGKAIELLSDGKILVAGNTYTSSASNFALVRYNGDNNTTGIENNFESFVIMPNPASDNITIEAGQGNKIIISDIAGKVVYSCIAETALVNIDISSLPQGMYFVTLYSNTVNKTTKLIKN